MGDKQRGCGGTGSLAAGHQRQAGEEKGEDCACKLYLICLKSVAVSNNSKCDAGFPYVSC